MQNWLTAVQQGTSAEDKATAAGLEQYFAGMKAAGYTSDNQQTGSISNETAIMQKLQHLDINTLGIQWARTSSNYENVSSVRASMEIINPNGSASLYN
jgi:hypothetical protein